MNIEQFSKEHLSAVLDALIRVKNGEIVDYEYGICWNSCVISVKYDSYDIISILSCRWGKFSGDKDYPVEGYKLYVETGDKWTGENGALRYELLDFLIDDLTKVVEKYDG